MLLYDADKIENVASSDEQSLVDQQLDMILDPFRSGGHRCGESQWHRRLDHRRTAQYSPTYKFVKTWGLALPLHPEFRDASDALLRTAAPARDGLGSRCRSTPLKTRS